MLRILLKNIAIATVIAVACLSAASIMIKKNQTTRYAVFAGYNIDGTLPPYVLTYLKALNEVCDGVVYIADSELNPKEEAKLSPLTIHYENKRHTEYDFGSYKRGYQWLKQNGYLENADELIFANDSAYAPMTSFKPMFEEMSKRQDLDFWGDLQNTRFTKHIQTYFFVIRKKIIHSKAFADFMNNITHQPDSSLYITEYEVKLTPMLENLGYKWDTYMPYKELSFLEKDSDKNTYPLTLISKYNHQFLKRRTFTDKLPIYEDKTALLSYIKKHFPKRYKEIKIEINPIFLPKEDR